MKQFRRVSRKKNWQAIKKVLRSTPPFFWLHLWHMEVPRPRIGPVPQQWPKPLHDSARSLTHCSTRKLPLPKILVQPYFLGKSVLTKLDSSVSQIHCTLLFAHAIPPSEMLFSPFPTPIVGLSEQWLEQMEKSKSQIWEDCWSQRLGSWWCCHF